MSTGSFDPYHRWLGIPPKHQPADYYRLLGIERFEEDREVIRDGADRQMAHVRTYQLGECSALSQKLLNELAGARACLLNPEWKTAYDARLRKQLSGQAVAAPPEPLQPSIPPRASIAPEVVAPPLVPGAISESRTDAMMTPTTKRHRPPALALTAGAAAALVLLGTLIWSLSDARDPQSRDSDSPAVAHRRPAERIAPTAAETPEPPDSQPAGTAPPLAVAPFDANQAARYQQAWAKYLGLPVEHDVDLGSGVKLTLVLIPPGEFMMGSPEDEQGRNSEREGPQHRVRITKPFYLGAYQVTQEEYERVMGTNPSHFSRRGHGSGRVSGQDTSRFPVENVSWNDAVEYCRRLSALPAERSSRREYRLPTEAEWEHACRAGTTTPFQFGSVLNGRQANCNGNYPYGTNEKGPYLERTTTVGSYTPNGFGLYDMHGNVWEWCAVYSDNYFSR